MPVKQTQNIVQTNEKKEDRTQPQQTEKKGELYYKKLWSESMSTIEQLKKENAELKKQIMELKTPGPQTDETVEIVVPPGEKKYLAKLQRMREKALPAAVRDPNPNVVRCYKEQNGLLKTKKTGETTKPCGRNVCYCCHMPVTPGARQQFSFLDTTAEFSSKATGERFIPALTNKPLNCCTQYTVYLITCGHILPDGTTCGLQYVGSTKRLLGVRTNEHRRDIKEQNKREVFARHFRKDGHTFWDMRVRIIEAVAVSHLANEDQKLDHLLERETFWIHQLGALYPHGLVEIIPKKPKTKK